MGLTRVPAGTTTPVAPSHEWVVVRRGTDYGARKGSTRRAKARFAHPGQNAFELLLLVTNGSIP
jgi:hypothetical protein